MVKNILSSIAIMIGSVVQTPDAEGWVPLERPQPYVEEFEEEKREWVVFSKEIEGETFHIQLPNDLTYRYVPSGILIDAFLESDRLQLRVEKRQEGETSKELFKKKIEEVNSIPGVSLMKIKRNKDEKILDLFYRFNEKWMWERLIVTSQLLYTFHTESFEISDRIHRQFIASLEVF